MLGKYYTPALLHTGKASGHRGGPGRDPNNSTHTPSTSPTPAQTKPPQQAPINRRLQASTDNLEPNRTKRNHTEPNGTKRNQTENPTKSNRKPKQRQHPPLSVCPALDDAVRLLAVRGEIPEVQRELTRQAELLFRLLGGRQNLAFDRSKQRVERGSRTRVISYSRELIPLLTLRRQKYKGCKRVPPPTSRMVYKTRGMHNSRPACLRSHSHA